MSNLSRPRLDSLCLTSDIEPAVSSTSSYVRRLMKDGTGHPKYPRVADSLVEYKAARFLITTRPSNYTLIDYIHNLRVYSVTDLVRMCVSNYNIAALTREGITITDLVFDDGMTPSTLIVDKWMELLRYRFLTAPTDACHCVSVAVHCEEGLGRSPLMVGIALLEMGMKTDEVVEFLRERRRDVLNARQVDYLLRYQGKLRLVNMKGKRPSK